MMHHRERSVSGPQHPLGILACLVGTIAKVLGKATTGMVSEHLVQDFGGLGMASSVKSNFAWEQCCRPCKLTAFRFKASSCANYKFEHLTTSLPDLGISSSDTLVCHDLVCQSLSVRGFPHRAHAVRFNLFLLLRGLIQPVKYEKCWGENSGVLSGKTRQRHELLWVVLFILTVFCSNSSFQYIRFLKTSRCYFCEGLFSQTRWEGLTPSAPQGSLTLRRKLFHSAFARIESSRCSTETSRSEMPKKSFRESMNVDGKIEWDIGRKNTLDISKEI